MPAPARHDAPVAEDVYSDAEQRISQGQYAAAAAVLTSSLASAPRAAQSLYLLGVARLLEGRLLEARALIDRAFELKRWIKDVPDTLVDLQPAAEVAARLAPTWQWPRYELERRAFPSVGMTLAWVVGAVRTTDSTFFVQVGANDGKGSKDPIHQFVVAHRWSGLAVEPMPAAFERLCQTYAGNRRVRPVNVAIDDEDGVRPMFFPSNSDTTLASLLPDRNILSKQQGLQQVDVRCSTFASLFREHAVARVDVLQIDTEGYDYRVLRQFDFARFRPAIVNMEFFCLPLDERLATFALLRRHGYAYRYDGKDLLAVDRARFDEALCIVDRTSGVWLD
jgi:FkbM family methyltransferase